MTRQTEEKQQHENEENHPRDAGHRSGNTEVLKCSSY
jgi:hypothetical protein